MSVWVWITRVKYDIYQQDNCIVTEEYVYVNIFKVRKGLNYVVE